MSTKIGQDDPLSVLFKKRVVEYLDKRGLNQSDLARASNSSRANISKILSEEGGSPRLITVYKVSVALGVPISSLLFEEDQKIPVQQALEIVAENLGFTGLKPMEERKSLSGFDLSEVPDDVLATLQKIEKEKWDAVRDILQPLAKKSKSEEKDRRSKLPS